VHDVAGRVHGGVRLQWREALFMILDPEAMSVGPDRARGWRLVAQSFQPAFSRKHIPAGAMASARSRAHIRSATRAGGARHDIVVPIRRYLWAPRARIDRPRLDPATARPLIDRERNARRPSVCQRADSTPALKVAIIAG